MLAGEHSRSKGCLPFCSPCLVSFLYRIFAPIAKPLPPLQKTEYWVVSKMIAVVLEWGNERKRQDNHSAGGIKGNRQTHGRRRVYQWLWTMRNEWGLHVHSQGATEHWLLGSKSREVLLEPSLWKAQWGYMSFWSDLVKLLCVHVSLASLSTSTVVLKLYRPGSTS